MSQDSPPPARSEQIDAIIADYLDAERTGQPLTPDELLRRYPEYAPELQSFFNDRQYFQQLADKSDAVTLPPPGTPTADAPGGAARRFGDYEVVAEIGRGGMGVVYKAHHRKLNRTAAVKMILAGGHAGSHDVARFLAEAEAVATFVHPNIVQVFEVGEQNGLPFMALEFVSGGSLADRLRQGPLPPREAARLVEQLAHGMNAAHQAGIVHRDLKPGNVLLQGKVTTEGTEITEKDKKSGKKGALPSSVLSVSSVVSCVPKITDFGLAKRVEGSDGLTQTGAILGTPSYMAPEQASGDGKRVGPAADVYALGAVLYECLTGRPPFQSPNSLDTLLQVVHQDPVPLRQINPKIPRDLETICLKCLHKQPAQRYASAEALAEDLRRWQAGEPIRARPVGSAERLVKWVRRNPLPTTVAAVILIACGAVFATILAYSARLEDQVEETKKQAKDADDARKVARKEAQDADEARQKIEETFIDSLLSRIGQTAGPGPVHIAERAALLELAGLKNDSVRYGLVRTGLAAEAKAIGMQRHAELLTVALVGTDSRKRQQVLRIVTERWRAADSSKVTRQVCAFIAVHLEAGEVEFSDEVADWFRVELKSAILDSMGALIQELAAISGKLDPVQRQKMALLLENLLPAKSEGEGYDDIVAWALATVAGKLEPKQGCQMLIAHLDKTKNDAVIEPLTQALVRTAGKLPPEQGVQLLTERLDKFLPGVGKEIGGAFCHQALAEGIATIAARMPPAQRHRAAEQAAKFLIEQAGNSNNSYAIVAVAKGLAAVAGQLEPQPAAELLIAQIGKTMDVAALDVLVERLALVAAKLPPEQGVQRLTEPLQKANNQRTKRTLALGLATVASQLPAPAAAKLLTEHMTKTDDPHVSALLAQGLGQIVGRLDAVQRQKVASETAHVLTENMAMADKLDPETLQVTAEALAAVIGGLEPNQRKRAAQQASQSLTEQLEKMNEPHALRSLALGLAAVHAALEAPERKEAAAQAVRLLTEQLPKVRDENTLQALAEGLAALSTGLEPAQKQKVLAQVARLLNEQFSRNVDLRLFEPLGHALIAVAARLEPQQGAMLLIDQMPMIYAPVALNPLAQGLMKIAPKLGKKGLANLLKYPLCVGRAQEIMLDELGKQTGQSFTSLWQFVAWAEQHEPDLDLAAPYQRP